MIPQRRFHETLRAKNGGEWFDFEGLIRDMYVSILTNGDTSLDVGVNIGQHFLQMAVAVGGEGTVIGIEASPEMVAATRNSMTISGYDRLYNLHLYNVAVSDHEGSATFCFVRDQPGLSSLADREVASVYQRDYYTVPVTTIDKVLVDFPRRVAFAKIDIEGAEYNALCGANRLLKSDRPPIVFEFDLQSPAYFGYDPADLLGIFKMNGYRVYDFFGFEYVDSQELMESGVWNYVAVPSGYGETRALFEIVADTLRSQGLDLAQLKLAIG
jgi:FkbM family methyltransferase